MTIADHGFSGYDGVYHPSAVSSNQIGRVVERYTGQDIAMVELLPTVNFTNSKNFQAAAPNRLLYSDRISEGAWCAADGLSTGLVFLHRTGIRAVDIQLMRNHGMESILYRTEIIYSSFGPLGGESRRGIRGAPIVSEKAEQTGHNGGGVCGFLRFANGDVVLSPILDDIIESGWELADDIELRKAEYGPSLRT